MGKPIKRGLVKNPNEPSSVPQPQPDNLKTAPTAVLVGGVNIASYPRARPQTSCLRAGFGDDPESPATSPDVEVWRVDCVVDSLRLVSHQTSLHPFHLPPSASRRAETNDLGKC